MPRTRNKQTRRTKPPVPRQRNLGAIIRRLANASPQGQGINLAERNLRKINQDNRRRKR